jgi:SAC3 family protein LENG8/THP3
LTILEQAFDFVMNKYQASHDWLYISNQLKSIRQDLMVQSIRNDFTILVYEENARLALAMVISHAVNLIETTVTDV